MIVDRGLFRQILIGAVCNLLVIDSGLHEGWSTPTLPKFEGEDPVITLTSDQSAWVINIMYVGVGLGSLVPMLLMDRIGRKWTLFTAAGPKVVSWLLIAYGRDYLAMIIARLLAGVGCGITYSVTPMYLGEITSKSTRGPLGTSIAVLINIGVLLIYAIGLWVSRQTMALIAVWIPVTFIVAFIWLPESSIYLTRKNRMSNAELNLKWSLGKDNVDEELEEIKRMVAHEEEHSSSSFIESLKLAISRRGNIRACGIALIVISCLTLTGAAPIMAYQSYIFKQAGFDVSPNISIITNGSAVVIASLTCVILVKFTGKRLLLLISAPICALSFVAIATFFTLQAYGTDVTEVRWIPTVFVVIFVLAYGLALNPTPLVYVGEIFSLEVKAPASILCSLYYAVATTVTVKSYQTLQESYGTHTPFWVFSVITTVLWALIYFFVPETEGKSLQEIQMELARKKNPT
ncbi:facilitated trehalose transporter Tret1-2 homolog [Orussus abietinus]|uniref:facilitated trehalose transporter Tret1-2 homolog n=1 Tax=Orussus abietinus TaxID=222816 RepID=UPI0006262F7E|nr:facilitated trehalose transporter Tret1-2 homolog [Orussus abietinus]